MKRLTLALFLYLSILGCKPHSRNTQIDDVCKCYNAAKTYSNTTKKLQKMDECYLKTQEVLNDIERVAIEDDWSDAKLIKEKQDFINAIEKNNDIK